MITTQTNDSARSTHSPPDALNVSAVSKRFGNLTAVNNVSLTVPPGQVLALLGPNGAGKTTLLDMILGFTQPDAGSLQVLGHSPKTATSRGKIGALLQTEGLLNDLSVAETVRMVASCHRRHVPVAEVMRRAGLYSFSSRKVGKCSGGQVQRLRFGLALLTDPEFLVLDEPTAGMDATVRRTFWATMHEEAARGRTVIFATHYLQEADDFADRLVLLSQGRVVEDGTVAEITAHAQRTVTGVWAGDQCSVAPEEIARRFQIPDDDWSLDQTASSSEESQVRFQVDDSDALAAELLSRGLVRDLQIKHPTVEDKFIELTAEAEAETSDAASTVNTAGTETSEVAS